MRLNHPDHLLRNIYLVMEGESKTPPYWPQIVTVHLTDRCNHHCHWCWHRRSDSTIEMEKAIECLEMFVNKGVREIVISGGGEPLLHPKIRLLLEYLSRQTHIERRLYTNGSLLKKNPLVAKAFNYVRVSIDAGGADLYSKLHGVPAKHYHSIFAALGTITRDELITGVSMVMTEEAAKSSAALLQDCERYGIRFLFLKPLMEGLRRKSSPMIYNELNSDYVSIVYKVPPPIRENMPTPPGEFSAANIFLSSDSKVYPCCHLITDEWEISPLEKRELEAALGSSRHLCLLAQYSATSHPCRLHDLWQRICWEFPEGSMKDDICEPFKVNPHNEIRVTRS